MFYLRFIVTVTLATPGVVCIRYSDDLLALLLKIPLTNNFVPFPKPRTWIFPHHMSWSFYIFSELGRDVIVRFGEIVDYIYFLFTIQLQWVKYASNRRHFLLRNIKQCLPNKKLIKTSHVTCRKSKLLVCKEINVMHN